MPSFYGTENVVASALQGLFGRMDRRGQQRREDEERRIERERQAKADASAERQAAVGRALQRYQMQEMGIREGTAPMNGGMPVPVGMGGVAMVPDQRYTDLGEGLYVDRNATPRFREAQAAQETERKAIAQREALNAAIGQALQDPDPSTAVQRLIANGMSPAEAKTTIEASRAPDPKAPVMGSPEYLAAKRAELELQDEFKRREEGRKGEPLAPGVASGMKLPTAAMGRLEAIKGTKRALQDYRALLEKYGVAVMSGGDEGRNQLDAAFGGVKMALKEALNLGVINGPDLKILEEQLSQPTGVKASLWKGKKALQAQVDQVMKSMDAREQTIYQIYGGGAVPNVNNDRPPLDQFFMVRR